MKQFLGIALAAVGTAASAAIPAGTYSNQCYVVEADDLGGMTITLTYKQDLPQVELEECEGGCWTPPVSNEASTPSGITFVAITHTRNGDAPVRYVAKFSKNVLLVTAPGHPEIEPQHLKVRSDLNRRFDCGGRR